MCYVSYTLLKYVQPDKNSLKGSSVGALDLRWAIENETESLRAKYINK